MRTIDRDIVGGFIFSSDGYIVLGQSRPGGVYPGFMMIPGGGVDDGETQEQAIRREILEEVGIDTSDATIVLVNDAQTGESEKTLRDSGERVLVRMHFHDFSVKLPKPAAEITINADDDFVDAVWVALDDLPTLTLTEPTKATLRKIGLLGD